jgi:predicted MFS family arabinose efflux permease
MTGNIVGALSAPLAGLLIDTQGYDATLFCVSSVAIFTTVIIYIALEGVGERQSGRIRQIE